MNRANVIYPLKEVILQNSGTATILPEFRISTYQNSILLQL